MTLLLHERVSVVYQNADDSYFNPRQLFISNIPSLTHDSLLPFLEISCTANMGNILAYSFTYIVHFFHIYRTSKMTKA